MCGEGIVATLRDTPFEELVRELCQLEEAIRRIRETSRELPAVTLDRELLRLTARERQVVREMRRRRVEMTGRLRADIGSRLLDGS